MAAESTVKYATINFHPDLHNFLAPKNRKADIGIKFKGRQSLKHLIESLGLPHTEVGQVNLNREPCHLEDIAQDNDFIEVLPHKPIAQLAPNQNYTFILDNHLGKLSHYLRLLGFDCFYSPEINDDQLAEIAVNEQRILLTRDRRLLMRREISAGYCPRSLQPDRQVIEVINRYSLSNIIHPFCRCVKCNNLLVPVDKAQILDQLLPLTRQYYDDFHQCPQCMQIYWQGSHFKEISHFIDQILAQI